MTTRVIKYHMYQGSSQTLQEICRCSHIHTLTITKLWCYHSELHTFKTYVELASKGARNTEVLPYNLYTAKNNFLIIMCTYCSTCHRWLDWRSGGLYMHTLTLVGFLDLPFWKICWEMLKDVCRIE